MLFNHGPQGPPVLHVLDVPQLQHTWFKRSDNHQALLKPDNDPFIWIRCVAAQKTSKTCGAASPKDEHWKTSLTLFKKDVTGRSLEFDSLCVFCWVHTTANFSDLKRNVRTVFCWVFYRVMKASLSALQWTLWEINHSYETQMHMSCSP